MDNLAEIMKKFESLESRETTEQIMSEEAIMKQIADYETLFANAIDNGGEDMIDYYTSKIDQLLEKLDNNEKEISFGQSARYWEDKAAEERAKNGETARYRKCIRNANKEIVKEKLDR